MIYRTKSSGCRNYLLVCPLGEILNEKLCSVLPRMATFLGARTALCQDMAPIYRTRISRGFHIQWYTTINLNTKVLVLPKSNLTVSLLTAYGKSKACTIKPHPLLAISSKHYKETNKQECMKKFLSAYNEKLSFSLTCTNTVTKQNAKLIKNYRLNKFPKQNLKSYNLS